MALSSARQERRARHRRAHTDSFSRCWRRSSVGSVVLATLLTGSIVLPARAITSAATVDLWTGTVGDGNWSTAGNWVLGIPDGSNGIPYSAQNTTGQAITHSGSTGPGGVDTINDFSTNGSFYMTGGTLSGSQSGANFSVTGSSTSFQISGNAVLKNFALSGDELDFTGNATLDTDTVNSNINLNPSGTFGTGATATLRGVTLNGTATSSGTGVFALDAGTLQGTGTISLNNSYYGGGNVQVVDGKSATIGSGITINGNNGAIGGSTGSTAVSLVNNGTISSDTAGTLSVQSGSFTNNNLVRALNGSTLNLNSSTMQGTAGKLFVDSTSVFNVNNATITGGLMTGGGTFGLNNVTLSGLTVAAGTTVTANPGGFYGGGQVDTFNNVTLNGTALVSGTSRLVLSGLSQTLSGTGIVSLDNTYYGGGYLSIEGGAAATLASGLTVRGNNGIIGDKTNNTTGLSSLISNALISSDTGGTLTIRNLDTFQNNATIQAIVSNGTGSTLNLSSNTTQGTNGKLLVDAASTFNINNANVTGGLLTGGGSFGLNNVTLSGLTVAAGTTVNANPGGFYGGGQVNTFNNVTLNGTALASGTSRIIIGGSSLSGSGVISLDGTYYGGGYLSVEGGASETLASGLTIHGNNGVIGDKTNTTTGLNSLTSNALISSDTGGTLTIRNLDTFQNNATIQAIATVPTSTTASVGSTLNLGSSTMQGANGKLLVDSTSAFNINSATITGGLLTGGGTFSLSNSALSSLTVDSGTTIDGDPGGFYAGGTTNTLTNVTLNGKANVTGPGNLVLNSGTLLGTGTVTLNGAYYGGAFLGITNGQTATLGSGITVNGNNGAIGSSTGSAAASLINNGIISSDTAGTLTIQPGSFTNNNLVRALVSGGTGSIINLNSNTTQGVAGKLFVDATSAFNINNATISGGLMTGGGTFSLSNSALSSLTVDNGTTIDGDPGGFYAGGTTNTLTNVTLNGKANVTGPGNLVLSSGTLLGTGTVTLNSAYYGSGSLSVANGQTATLGSGITVNGNSGTIGSSTGSTAVSLVNNGLISSDTGGTLTAQPSTLQNNGTLQVKNSSTLNVNATSFTNSGTIKADGSGTINITNAFVSRGGTFEADNGATLTVSTPFTGDGSVRTTAGSTVNLASNLTQSAAGSVSQVDGAAFVQGGSGTLTVAGGTLQGTGAVNAQVVNIGGTVSPGDSPGILTVNGSYTQGRNGILNIEFAATPTTEAHDTLVVQGGTTTLAGTLNVNYLSSSVTTPAFQKFDFLDFTGSLVNGNTGATDPFLFFANEFKQNGSYYVNGPAGQYSTSSLFQITMDNTHLYITPQQIFVAPAPEPSQYAAFGIGLLGLSGLVLRARRRTAA